MTEPDRRWWFNFPVVAEYAVAVGSVAAALISSQFLEVYAVTAPVSLFLCAVMFSAWFGRFGPGLFAATLSILAFKYYYAPPLHTLAVDVKEIPRIFVFGLSALFAGLLSAAQRSATESLKRARDDLDRSVHELKRSNEALHAENAERIRGEEALRNAQADLARAARLTTMGELAASIAHEVNQPLMAIVTNADTSLRWLAQDPPDLDEARQAAERIVRAGHRAGDIIRTIHALARKSTPEMTRFDVNAAIADVLTLTRGELRRHDLLLETELAADLEPVLGDRGQMQQVILNLIVNGIEAMTAGMHRPRMLRVSSEMAGPGNVLIAVADTGMGLDPTKADHIFDTFFTTKPEGMGMGLAICRSIVETHGGRLWASPNSPRGSIFQFTVPVATNGLLNDSSG
jgi:C4-dicarboxylate-specific signal transduction histidine kinase